MLFAAKEQGSIIVEVAIVVIIIVVGVEILTKLLGLVDDNACGAIEEVFKQCTK